MLEEFLPAARVATTVAPLQGRENLTHRRWVQGRQAPAYPRRVRARTINSTSITITMSAGLCSTVSTASGSSDRSFILRFSLLGGMNTRGGAGYTVAHPAGFTMREGCEDSRWHSSGGSPSFCEDIFVTSASAAWPDTCPAFQNQKNTHAATTAPTGLKSPPRGTFKPIGARAWDNVEGRRCAVAHEPSCDELGA